MWLSTFCDPSAVRIVRLDFGTSTGIWRQCSGMTAVSWRPSRLPFYWRWIAFAVSNRLPADGRSRVFLDVTGKAVAICCRRMMSFPIHRVLHLPDASKSTRWRRLFSGGGSRVWNQLLPDWPGLATAPGWWRHCAGARTAPWRPSGLPFTFSALAWLGLGRNVLSKQLKIRICM